MTKIPTSKPQEQMTPATLPTSPQSSPETHEQTASTVHTPVVTITKSMSLPDSSVTSTVKEPVGSSTTTILFSLATPPETPQMNQTPTSGTPGKAGDTDKPLPSTTTTVTNTILSTTTTLRTTVLSTVTSETQERDTTAPPTTPATPPATSEPADAHHNTVTQTPSQAAQTSSGVSTTLVTAVSPPKSTTAGMRSSVSPSPGEADMTMMTPLMASSTPEDAVPSPGTGISTVPEKSTLPPPSSTLDKVSDTNKSLPSTTTGVTNTTLPTMTTLRTTVLSTAASETQERDTTAKPTTPATPPTTSKSAGTHHYTVTQPAQGTGTTQSPHRPTALGSTSSETTKSSTMLGTSKAPPSSSQSSSLGGGTCALDESPASTGGCMCNESYYSHLELSREITTLRCRPQDIEVALLSCLLKTHHWVLKEETFLTCFSINRIEQGHRVQVFQLEKKEGTCGLHITSNISHALHSLDMHFEQVLPGSSTTSLKKLHFSCADPLVVNVSEPVSGQEVSTPTIHVPSAGETAVTINIFTDSELTTPLKNSTAPIGMPLYVVLKSASSNSSQFALVANEVFASTNLSNTEARAAHHFVKDSCPIRGRMLQELSNGASIYVILAFTLSRFLNSDMLYLHAQVTLCDKQAGHPCQPSCSGKNPLRRNSPWDTRAGTHVEPGGGKWIVFGPLRISESRASSSRSPAGAWTAILLLMVIGWMLE
ncbi:mucin-5AC-like [Acomys russatus]|uniref:mucin-5AC-like n=1 Tax=Acomys russatus TaxID=60746 RepID=UPI0021E2E1C1|nr:mucin-5AC-like [Acomys russatus]